VDCRLRDCLPALIGNPFRDEGAAFRLVFVTIGVFGLIALGSWISTWVGLGVVVGLISGIAGLVWRRHVAGTDTAGPPVRRLLVDDGSHSTSELAGTLRSRGDVQVVVGGSDVSGAVEIALRTFAADEIVVLDPTIAAVLRARFVVPVRLAGAEGYLPEAAATR
jgi:hypothetical protein